MRAKEEAGADLREDTECEETETCGRIRIGGREDEVVMEK